MTQEMNVALIVEGKYRLDKKIGEGAFGKIFSGINRNTNEKVAVKIEQTSPLSPLQNEARIYAAIRGVKGVPRIRSWGTEGKYNYLVIDLLGESLEDRRICCGGKINQNDVMCFGLQMLERIRDIHDCGLIHRDIKPGNFVFGGSSNPETLFVIDFGLTKVYRLNKKHIAMKQDQSMLGTERFASLNIHNGFTPSRRDDIESLGYVIVYLLLGGLPWQHSESTDSCIVEMKRCDMIWKTLRERGIPNEVITFLKYARGMEYQQKPDYEYLIGLLKNYSC